MSDVSNADADGAAIETGAPALGPVGAETHGQPGRRLKDRVAEMIRVDQAGEYGAVRIYEGQLAVLRHAPGSAHVRARLEHMRDDEVVHLTRFNEIVNESETRPTALAPFWHVAGYALGVGTALMGEKAAHACTAAVETVIDEHYQRQIATLEKAGPEHRELKETIATFREEEIAHRDEALASGAEEAPGYRLLSGAIKLACRAAIRISEKV